jgi:two-component system CheB/CheR fusion protein
LAAPLNASSEIVPSLEGLHILAVDDQIDTPDLGEFAIESYGAEVLTCICQKYAQALLSRSDSLL